MLNLNHLKLIIVAYFLLALPLSAQDIVDMNRLIDVTTLAQLNAMRYDLDGNGEPTNDPATTLVDEAALYRTAFGISGAGNNTCTGGTCQGYELTDHLDFNADMDPLMTGIQPSAWAEGGTIAGGWVPIGDDSSPFNTTFEGNRRTISNLYINTTTLVRVGLFGSLGSGVQIRNLGLEGGSVSSTARFARVGSLAGESNASTIRACYAKVDVEGTGAGPQVGGLVGRNSEGILIANYSTGDVTGGDYASVGGLIGFSSGKRIISACYATGDVTGGDYASVSGLMGFNYNGTTSACYSTGSARGGTEAKVGGLVGRNFSGTISACYATGDISGGNDAVVGGLVGQDISGTISNSYFDRETATLIVDGSELASKVGIGTSSSSTDLAKTTSELQLPEDYTAIYSAWNVDIGGTSAADDPWDFVGHNRYPRLRVDFDGDAAPTAAEFGAQRFYFTKTDPGIEVFSLSVSDEAVAPTIIGYAKALSGTTTWALTDANFAINSGTGVITVKVAGATVATKMLSIEAMVGSVTTELNLNVEVTDVTAGSSSPTISSFQDAAGTITSALRGATVKIIGMNFSATEANNTITVGGIEVIPTSPTAPELTFTVPLTATLGLGPIRVTVSGAANYVQEAFTITAPPSPTITRFEDAGGAMITSALRGATVKIIGTKFSTTEANNTITVGGIEVIPTAVDATATELTFTVPLTASLGSGNIQVEVSGAVNHDEAAFMITTTALPTIIRFEDAAAGPITSAPRGDIVKIVGTNFSTTPANNTITVGSATATPTNATATELTFTVPLTATLGLGQIRVTVSGAANYVEEAFTITAPPPLAFAEASTSDTDVGFTGAMGAEKAKYVVTKTLDEVDASGDVVLTLNVAPSGTTTYAYVDMDGADADAPTGLVSPIPASGAISTTAALAVTSSATVFYVQATQGGNTVIAKVALSVKPIVFAAPSPVDADVAFTGASGTEKAKYVVTKTLDEVDASGDVVLTLNVDPSGTTAYAYVDMDGALTLTPPSRLVRPIPASGAISTTAALAVTSSAAVFYVQATQGGNTAIAKVELTVTAAATTDFLGLTNPVHDLVSLYPNPASDRVYVSGLKSGDVYIYEVYSFLGQKVGTGQLSEGPSIDLKGLSAGAYVLILRSESGEEVFRSRCLISK